MYMFIFGPFWWNSPHIIVKKREKKYSCCYCYDFLVKIRSTVDVCNWFPPRLILEAQHDPYEEYGRDDFTFGNGNVPNGVDSLHKDCDGPSLSKLRSSSTAQLHPKNVTNGETKPTSMPPASVMTRLILIMVWRKLIRNPNTYSSLIGLVWSLVSFRWEPYYPSSKNSHFLFSSVMNHKFLWLCVWSSGPKEICIGIIAI